MSATGRAAELLVDDRDDEDSLLTTIERLYHAHDLDTRIFAEPGRHGPLHHLPHFPCSLALENLYFHPVPPKYGLRPTVKRGPERNFT